MSPIHSQTFDMGGRVMSKGSRSRRRSKSFAYSGVLRIGREIARIFPKGRRRSKSFSPNPIVPPLNWFLLLDPWLADSDNSGSIYSFFLPIIDVVNGKDCDHMLGNIENLFKDKVIGCDIREEDQKALEKYKPFFKEAFCVLDAIFKEEEIFTNLREKVSEPILDKTTEAFFHSQVSPDFRKEVDTEVMTLAFHIHSYLFMFYDKMYGEGAGKRDLSQEKEGHLQVSKGVKKGFEKIASYLKKPHLKKKFDHLILAWKETEDWEKRDFISPLRQFKEDKNSEELAKFVKAIFYIITEYDKKKEKKDVALDSPIIYEILEASINLQLPEYQKKYDLESIVLLLDVLENMLDDEVSLEGDIIPDMAEALKAQGRETFFSNGIEMDTKCIDRLENEFTVMGGAYTQRVLTLVRLLKKHLRDQYLKKESPSIKQGIKHGVVTKSPFSKEAESFIDNAQEVQANKNREAEAAARKTDSTSGRAVIPPKKLSLLQRIKAKWKALPLKWKIIAGIVLALEVAGGIVAAILFPPSVILTLKGIGVTMTITSGMVIESAAVAAGATAVIHTVHVARTSPVEQKRLDNKKSTLPGKNSRKQGSASQQTRQSLEPEDKSPGPQNKDVMIGVKNDVPTDGTKETSKTVKVESTAANYSAYSSTNLRRRRNRQSAGVVSYNDSEKSRLFQRPPGESPSPQRHSSPSRKTAPIFR